MKKQVIALLSDIHSNFQAFKACYEDAVNNSAETFIFLGDYISDLSETIETMGLLYDIKNRYQSYFLRGNRERYMLEHHKNNLSFSIGSKTGSLLYTYEQLQPNDFIFFNNIPAYDKIKFGNHCFEIAHSLKDNDRYYYDENSAFLNEVFEGMETNYFLTGHSHRQYIARRGCKTVVNPGSVGVPRGNGSVAQYCLIEITGDKVEFVFRSVDYDIKKLVRKQFSSGLVDKGKTWSASILYDVITGREYTMELLNRVLEHTHNDLGAVNDERLWKRFADELKIGFTENEIMELIE